MGERPYRTAVWRDTVLCKKRKKNKTVILKKSLFSVKQMLKYYKYPDRLCKATS